MKKRHVLLMSFAFILIFNFFALATQVTKTSTTTTVALIVPHADDYYFGYPSGFHNIGGAQNGLNFEKARTLYKFDIGDIPENSIISSVTISCNFSSYISSKDCEITFADPISGVENQYWEISSASVALSLDSYGGGGFSSTAIKNDLSANLGATYYYLGAYSPDEYIGDSDAQLDLSLTITYTPIVYITVKNNFIGGTIKVDGTNRTSPYSLLKTVGTTLSLEAIDQTNAGYYKLWNDNDAPSNKSVWTKWNGSSPTIKSYSKNYSFTVATNDDNTEFEAGLRKRCNTSFTNSTGGGTIKVNGVEKTSLPYSTTVIEKNNITGLAINHSSNGIDYTFTNWSPGGSTSYETTFTPEVHTNYTANFTGRPNNTYRNQYFIQKL